MSICPKFRIGWLNVIPIPLSESCISAGLPLPGLLLQVMFTAWKKKIVVCPWGLHFPSSTPSNPVHQLFIPTLPKIVPTEANSGFSIAHQELAREVSPPPNIVSLFSWSWGHHLALFIPVPSSDSFLAFHRTLCVGCPEAHTISLMKITPTRMSLKSIPFNPDITPNSRPIYPNIYWISLFCYLNIMCPELTYFFCLSLLLPLLKPRWLLDVSSTCHTSSPFRACCFLCLECSPVCQSRLNKKQNQLDRKIFVKRNWQLWGWLSMSQFHKPGSQERKIISRMELRRHALTMSPLKQHFFSLSGKCQPCF